MAMNGRPSQTFVFSFLSPLISLQSNHFQRCRNPLRLDRAAFHQPGQQIALVQRKFHFRQKGGPAQVAVQAAQHGIAFHFTQAAVALLVGTFVPLEGFVRIADEPFRNLKQRVCLVVTGSNFLHGLSCAASSIPPRQVPRPGAGSNIDFISNRTTVKSLLRLVAASLELPPISVFS